MKRIVTHSILLIHLFVFLNSCNDFLDIKPRASLTESALTTKDVVEALLVGAYAMVDGTSDNTDIASAASNWVYGSITGGDAHKGASEQDLATEITTLELYEARSTNEFINIKWKAVYEGISRANSVLKQINSVTDAQPEDLHRIGAEAHTLRGIFHFEARKLWKMVPFIDEHVDPSVVKNEIDIWPHIESDLKFGYENLPDKMDAVGRLNKWAAGAIYAKALIFEGKYGEAKIVLEDIYVHGVNPLGKRYALSPLFADNFNVEKENGNESVFAFQYSVNDGALGFNGSLGEVYNYPVGGPSNCCGFFQPSSDLVNSYRTDAQGLPLLDGSYNDPGQAVKDDETYEPFIEDTGRLDPRLDWTVGRKGIPYLDWGDHPGREWWFSYGNGGPYNPKKNVFRKSQQGEFTDASWSNFNANNYTVIRFADVILWLAECEVEIGSLTAARDYVNEIRSRAANLEGFVTEADGVTPAANYVVNPYPSSGYPFDTKENARKAVHFERKLELAMEGHRFFDLVRWNEAASTLNEYLKYESKKRTYMKEATFEEGVDEYYPIPQHQIDLMGSDILKPNQNN